MQLDAAARRGDIKTLKGFGARHEERILAGIAFLHRRTGRLSIGTALPAAGELAATLSGALATRVEIAGSVRRMCETVANLDFAAATVASRALAAAARGLLRTQT